MELSARVSINRIFVLQFPFLCSTATIELEMLSLGSWYVCQDGELSSHAAKTAFVP